MFTLAMQGWCPWCGGHMGWNGGWFMMLVWLVLLVAIVWFAWMILQRDRSGSGPATREDRAEAILRERYARGEIDETTYRRMLEELRRP